MKRLHYLFGTLGTIVIFFGAILLYRLYISEQVIGDLPEDWEKLFEMERVEIRNNFDLIKDRIGYYKRKDFEKLINNKVELDTLSYAFDGLSLQGIIIADKDKVLFQTSDSSFGTGWYSYGDNSYVLKKYNFEVEQVIAGRDNWFYIKTRNYKKNR